MQEGVFFHFGQLSAMALIQGGGAMNFLGASTYNFMRGMKPADIIVSAEEVTDNEAKLILERYKNLIIVCVYTWLYNYSIVVL